MLVVDKVLFVNQEQVLYDTFLVNSVNSSVFLMDNDNYPLGVIDHTMLPGNDSNTSGIDA